MTRWVVEHLGPDVPLHFTRFHPEWKMTGHAVTPTATLQRARAIGLRNGLHHVYTGNVHDRIGSSTYCHHCGAVLIGRDWYELSGWNLAVEGGRAACRACGTPVAGIFEAEPGTWGSRRQAIHVHH